MQGQLQDHLAQVCANQAPLPLTKSEAVSRAVVLRSRRWTYRAIAQVMGEYHGQWYAERTWREWCREHGAPRFVPHRGFGATR